MAFSLSFRADVAALYVAASGPYPGLVAEWWDEHRDARRYDGPWPVVAHPPYAHWGRLRAFATRPGKDCGPRAVEQVRRWGGVLEHPETSLLWAECGMPAPGAPPDEWGGVTLVIDQGDHGHRARKRTWLYIIGHPGPVSPPPEIRHPRPGIVSRSRRVFGPKLPEIRKSEREPTPYWLAQWLVDVAARCRPGTEIVGL